MFTRLAFAIVHHPKRVFAASLVVLVLAVVTMAVITPNPSTEFELGASAESRIVSDRMRKEFGLSEDAIVMIFSGSEAMAEPDTLQAVDSSLAGLVDDPRISALITPAGTGSPALIANDGESVLAIAHVSADADIDSSDLDEISETVTTAADANNLDVAFGGRYFIEADINHRTEESLIRAEMVSIPIAIVVLLLVFGSLVAAGMPMVVGAASIILATAVVMYWSTRGYQSIFGLNMITMLGLGLGIDYSLFFVKRYRDELKQRPQDEALALTIQTVGKAIFFSGVTVLLGLGATQFFDMPPLKSLGQAGMIVTASSMFFGLTLLPSTLQLLGSRINRGKIGRGRTVDETGESAFWARVAHSVMARPVVVLVATMALLAVLASPLADINLVQGGPDILPASSEPRQVSEQALAQFPRAAADPIYVLVDSTDAATISALTETISGFEDITAVTIASQNEATLLEVNTSRDSHDAMPIVGDIRDLSTLDAPVLVGGIAAFNADSEEIVMDNLLPAALFVLTTSYVVLLLTFGSVLLPIKAMFMSALSISASLGVVVWIFQQGHFENLLGFGATGAIVHMVPILIACVLFGLSMDYEVLLLSRIQEEYLATGDNRGAIATGLAHTGQVVSGAATIMVAVFGGFVLADVVLIKSLGFGLAFAVLLDATIVRGVLVPTTMRLMGRWNWWSPAWLTGIIQRTGVSHADPRPESLAPAGLNQVAPEAAQD